jgi:hypothetical protein
MSENAGTPGEETYTIETSTTTDTSMSLKLSSNKPTPGATFTASGKLIDAVADLPISGKSITFTIDGNPAGGPVTTNSKGEFEVNLNAPDSPGKYDIKAHFDGESQYKSSDSSVKITVEEDKLSSQKTTVTTNQQTTG